MRAKTAIVSFVLGLLLAISLTAAAGVIEGDGAPFPSQSCDTTAPATPPGGGNKAPTGKPIDGGYIEGTG
jgi:hypothetical protein